MPVRALRPSVGASGAEVAMLKTMNAREGIKTNGLMPNSRPARILLKTMNAREGIKT